MPAGAGARGAARRLRRDPDRPGRRAASSTATALASIAGNLSGSMTATPRVTYALAEPGLAAALVRRGQRALGDAGQFDPVHGRWSGARSALTGSFVWLADRQHAWRG